MRVIKVILSIFSYITLMTSMLDLSVAEEEQLIKLTIEPLKAVPGYMITRFAMQLFPLTNQTQPLNILFKNMVSFYGNKIDKSIDFDIITGLILSKARDKDEGLFVGITKMFEGPFGARFKKYILKSKGMVQPKYPYQPLKDSTVKAAQNRAPPPHRKGKIIDLIDEQSPNTQAPQSNEQSSKQEAKKSKSSLTKEQKSLDKKPEQVLVPDLKFQDMCFCGKHLGTLSASQNVLFTCFYCDRRYHTACMRRTEQSQLCLYCNLKRLIPNKEVKKILFAGILQKNRKKHIIKFSMLEQDLSIRFKIQVRCFRLKPDCDNFILFPDAAKFKLKDYEVQDFQPIHRQSSLKYRKDEPFYLPVRLLKTKDNELNVIEKKIEKQNKDERIDPENHFIAIYVVEEKKPEQLIKEISNRCVTSFNQSKLFIDQFFEKSHDEVLCEYMKIQLLCPLTTQKVKCPARGRFCKHYQCFDLNNFLNLTIQATNPRWFCPICKKPAFDLRVDIILLHILQKYKNNQEATEVIFLSSGQYQVFAEKERIISKQNETIYQLPIEGITRTRDLPRTAEQMVAKKKKVTETILG